MPMTMECTHTEWFVCEYCCQCSFHTAQRLGNAVGYIPHKHGPWEITVPHEFPVALKVIEDPEHQAFQPELLDDALVSLLVRLGILSFVGERYHTPRLGDKRRYDPVISSLVQDGWWWKTVGP